MVGWFDDIIALRFEGLIAWRFSGFMDDGGLMADGLMIWKFDGLSVRWANG